MNFDALPLERKFHFEGDILEKEYVKIDNERALLGNDIVVKIAPQTAVVARHRPLKGLVDLIYEFEGCNPLWVMARGHVDKDEFVAEAAREWGVEYKFPASIVEYAYARNIPTGHKGEQIINISEPRRGAYPITYIDLEKPFNRS